MWRIQPFVLLLKLCHRIISTYVENTGVIDWDGVKGEDHLHLRGEYTGDLQRDTRTLGSSPLTWRIHMIVCPIKTSCRIISTYVENTNNCKASIVINRDHLHLRGEYVVAVAL